MYYTLLSYASSTIDVSNYFTHSNYFIPVVNSVCYRVKHNFIVALNNRNLKYCIIILLPQNNVRSWPIWNVWHTRRIRGAWKSFFLLFDILYLYVKNINFSWKFTKSNKCTFLTHSTKKRRSNASNAYLYIFIYTYLYMYGAQWRDNACLIL